MAEEKLKKYIFSYWGVFILFSIVSFALYGISLSDYFFPEDILKIQEGIEFFQQPSINYHSGSIFRPGSWLFYWIVHLALGMNPVGYRLLSIVLQGVVGFLIHVLFYRLLGNKIASFGGGIFFIFNIIQRNIIFYLSANLYILVEIYAILAILLFIKFLENKKPWAYIMSVVIFCLGILTHVSIIIILPVLVFFFFLREKELSKVHCFSNRKIVLYLAGKGLIFLPYILLFFGMIIIETYRGGIWRYHPDIYQSFKNIVVYTSAFYYPFTPFGFTEAIDIEHNMGEKLKVIFHLFVSNPISIAMVLSSLMTLLMVLYCLLNGKRSHRVGSIIFLSALVFYIPYHGISSRYINFGLLGISLMIASFMADNSYKISIGRKFVLSSPRTLIYFIVAVMLIFQPFLIYKEHTQYKRLADYCATFQNYFSNRDFSHMNAIEISGVPDYSIEGSRLIGGLSSLIPRWTNNLNLKVEINPDTICLPFAQRFIFQEPDKIIEIRTEKLRDGRSGT